MMTVLPDSSDNDNNKQQHLSSIMSVSMYHIEDTYTDNNDITDNDTEPVRLS